MRQSGRTAIGRWEERGKQYLVQLRVAERGIVLQQLLHKDEAHDFDEVEIPSARVNGNEYHNEVKARIEKMIHQKVSGHEIAAPESAAAPQGACVIDLMEALHASLRQGPKPATGSTARAAPAAEKRANGAKPRTRRAAAKTRSGTR